MAQHAPQTILFATNDGLVATSGGSTKLAQGVFGIVDKGAPNTKDGIPLTNTFSATPATRMFELKLGISPLTPSFGRSNKAYSSRPFTLSEVADISVSAPSLKSSVDEFWIGWDGVNEDTAIVLENGETAVFDVTLSGEGVGFLGYPNGTITTKFYITAPEEGDVNMAKLISEAVEKFKKTTLVGGVPISNYVEITPINSTNPETATGTAYNLYRLNVPMDSTNANIGQVLAQYPTLDVKVDNTVTGQTSFIVAKAGTAPTAFNVVKTTITLDCGEYASSANTTTTIAWALEDTCTAVPVTYTLQLADDECGENRLAEVQAQYSDITITAGASVNCQTVYTTTVLSNFVCEECSPVIRDLFESEAPVPFNFVSWKRADENYDVTALMGVRFKGKKTVFAGSEYMRGAIPFVYDFVRLNVAGGYPTTIATNINNDNKEPYQVKLISIGSRPEGLGMDFYDLEDRTRVYYTGEQADTCNLYRQRALGLESMLKPLAQYVSYSIEIRPERFAQSFASMKKEPIRYVILAEVGKHKQIEAVVNALATAVGLPTVEAYEGN